LTKFGERFKNIPESQRMQLYVMEGLLEKNVPILL